MARRNRIVYGAAVLASALVLTACGGDGDSGEDDEIAGVQTPTEEAPEPEPSEDPEETEEEPADGRPEIDLGPDFENVYEGEPTGDPVVDAALRDLQGFEDAYAEAIVHHESDRPAVRYYATGDALNQVIQVLDGIFAEGISNTGTARYFNMAVTPIDDVSATFSYCRDFGQVNTTDFETGEVLEEGDPTAPASQYSGRLELNDEGVWQTVGYDRVADSSECQ
ncbi:hypothetical protein RM844_16745 [Streptomyces sp. DSM 44915]|uniref:Lipoprotein n=1 Tax=Streptomyces chisholmiae TaxID=3075540 RepID=A0ABU2JSG1_9ACTN|nr:hypothetical protein [Streptomyces sp. DSM 44915]MDT0267930.1 hypothetical protein [Streptomyces sp. DSM 44915]